MPPEAESVSSIACELCRQRKCKCDRNLPFCSQCSADPSRCNYPESGKRGLPLGYINRLEIRLAETELALYEALATLHTMNGPSLVRASRKAEISSKQKAARMEEWSRFPLREPSDLKRWLEAKRDQFMIMDDVRDMQRTIPPGASESPDSTMQRWKAPPSNMPGMAIGTDSPAPARPDRMETNPRMSIDQATSASSPGTTSWVETSRHGLPEQIQTFSGEVMMPGEEIDMGKAEQLLEKHSAIYF